MTVDFVKISPAGNITILVKTPVESRFRAHIAALLMSSDSVAGEQVGFLETPVDPKSDIRLEMMGGEFCANATMAAAAYLAHLEGGGEAIYTIEVSGCETPLAVKTKTQGGLCTACVPMPLPVAFDRIDIRGFKVPLVHLPGISHALLPLSCHESFSPDDIRGLAIGVDAEAFGLIFHENGVMRPYVYVKPTDTAIWESACGTGTAAVAAYLAFQHGHSQIKLRQPGGTLEAAAESREGVITRLTISGHTQVVVEGAAYID